MYFDPITLEDITAYMAFIRPHFRYYNVMWTRGSDGRIYIYGQG